MSELWRVGDCCEEKLCHLCNSARHLAKDCPIPSYAGATKSTMDADFGLRNIELVIQEIHKKQVEREEQQATSGLEDGTGMEGSLAAEESAGEM